MTRFQYRAYDLEMDFCEDGHGYWLDEEGDKKGLGTHEKGRSGAREKSFGRRQMDVSSPTFALWFVS